MLVFEGRDGTQMRLATDGQEYFTLTHAGVKAEGVPYAYTALCDSDAAEAQATVDLIRLFALQIEDQRAAHPGKVIEWRKRPNVMVEQEGSLRRVAVRARLAFVSP